jgi:hypothetical protein
LGVEEDDVAVFDVVVWRVGGLKLKAENEPSEVDAPAEVEGSGLAEPIGSQAAIK